MSDIVVVDTNVPISANGEGGIPDACVEACTSAIRDVIEERCRIALDDDWRIVTEYRRYLHADGQPGWGDRFLKWILNNQASPQRCQIVRIAAGAGEHEFAEFPRAVELEGFDPSDRKFVAVAIAHPDHPTILQATDSKWWGFRDALRSAGVEVRFLCSNYVEAKYERKFGSTQADS